MECFGDLLSGMFWELVELNVSGDLLSRMFWRFVEWNVLGTC